MAGDRRGGGPPRPMGPPRPVRPAPRELVAPARTEEASWPEEPPLPPPRRAMDDPTDEVAPTSRGVGRRARRGATDTGTQMFRVVAPAVKPVSPGPPAVFGAPRARANLGLQSTVPGRAVEEVPERAPSPVGGPVVSGPVFGAAAPAPDAPTAEGPALRGPRVTVRQALWIGGAAVTLVLALVGAWVATGVMGRASAPVAEPPPIAARPALAAPDRVVPTAPPEAPPVPVTAPAPEKRAAPRAPARSESRRSDAVPKAPPARPVAAVRSATLLFPPGFEPFQVDLDCGGTVIERRISGSRLVISPLPADLCAARFVGGDPGPRFAVPAGATLRCSGGDGSAPPTCS